MDDAKNDTTWQELTPQEAQGVQGGYCIIIRRRALSSTLLEG